MNCWHCKTELVWDSDVDVDEYDEYSMITFLNCPKCGSAVEIYKKKDNERNT